MIYADQMSSWNTFVEFELIYLFTYIFQLGVSE